MEMERGRSAGERWRVREAEAAGKEKHVFLNNPTNRKKISKNTKMAHESSTDHTHIDHSPFQFQKYVRGTECPLTS